MPSATAYGSVARAIAAARRLANRTGKPVKVLLRNPSVEQLRQADLRGMRARLPGGGGVVRLWKARGIYDALKRRRRVETQRKEKRNPTPTQKLRGLQAQALAAARRLGYASGQKILVMGPHGTTLAPIETVSVRQLRDFLRPGRKRNPARPDYSAVPWMVKQRERLAVDAAADARSRWKEAEALHGEGSKKERGAWRDYSAISRKILKTAGAISAQKRAYGSETLDALIAARGEGRRHARIGRNPRKPYPHKLASKYIRQEIRAGRKGAQAVAIGIARARRAKRNPYKLKGTFTGRATEEKPRGGGGKPHGPREIPFEKRRPTIGGLHKNPLRKPGDVGSFKLEEFGPTVRGKHLGWSSASESIARVKLLRGTRGYKKGAVLFVPRWKLEEGR